MDNCCCKNVRDNEECDSSTFCGMNPEVFIMTPEESEVVCKDWEIEDGDSGEEVVFKIEVILERFLVITLDLCRLV